MSLTEFQNRDTELSDYQRSFSESWECNTIILLAANHGVGKSLFCRKLLLELNHPYSLKVEILGADQQVQLEGDFIVRLAQELNSFSLINNAIPSINRFLRSLPGEYKQSEFIYRLRERISKGLEFFSPGRSLFDWIFSAGDFEQQHVFNPHASTNVINCYRYINHCLRLARFVINIENIQIADRISLRLLRSLIKDSNYGYFLFEYTTKSNSLEEVDRFAQYFRIEHVNVHLKRLSNLDFEHFKKILYQAIPGFAENKAKSIFINAKGNLWGIQDVEVLVSKDVDSSIEMINSNLLDGNISTLEKPALALLVFVAVHNSEIPMHLLRRSYSKLTSEVFHSNLDAAISSLSKHKLVEQVGQILKIHRDDVADELLNNKIYDKYRSVAFREISHYYQEVIRSNNFNITSGDYVLTTLISLYGRYSPINLFSLLDEIRNLAIRSLDPYVAIDHLQTLRKEIIKHGVATEQLNQINFLLLDLFYFLGLFEAAWGILEEINIENDRTIIYHAMLLNRLDHLDESLAYIKNRLPLDTTENPRLALSLKLIEMICFQSKSEYEKAKILHKDIAKNHAFKNQYEYGFFLRNTDVVLNYTQSIKSVKKSIVLFQSTNSVHEAHSRITLSLQLVRLGELKDATKQLRRAKKLLLGKTMELQVLYNNEAAIRLYNNQFDDETEELLRLSLLTTTTPFDDLVVHSNLTILYAKQRKKEAFDDTAKKVLVLIEEEPDQNEHRIAYFNLAFGYSEFEDDPSFQKFLNKAIKTSEFHDELWQHRLFRRPTKNAEFLFLSKFNYHSCFIAYWHFDIYNN